MLITKKSRSHFCKDSVSNSLKDRIVYIYVGPVAQPGWSAGLLTFGRKPVVAGSNPAGSAHSHNVFKTETLTF